MATAIVTATAIPASAHDPIFVDDSQTTPETGPYMPDGTISWALYGRVLEPGDTRGFEFDLADGDELFVSLLIPNLEPELSLDDAELPTLEVTTPSGETREFTPAMGEIFDEPFSKTSYVTLLEGREPAEAGRYKALVVGHAPARFSAVIGENEVFFTESERSGDRPTSFPEISAPLQAWYTTPPGEDAPTTTDAAGDEGEIQMDLIDGAVESGDVAATTDDTTTDDTVADDTTTNETVADADETVADAGDEADTDADTEAEADEDADTEADTDADTDSDTEAAEDADTDEDAESATGSDASEGSNGGFIRTLLIAVAVLLGVGGIGYAVNRSSKS